jgi:hypothetical protein
LVQAQKGEFTRNGLFFNYWNFIYRLALLQMIQEKFWFTPVVGTVGAFTTISVTEINEYMAMAIGVVTFVYTLGKCIDLFRNMSKK